MALVMNGLHCQRKKGKIGPGSPWRINTDRRKDLLRMLKTLHSLSLLSPASLTDKPLGASGRGAERCCQLETLGRHRHERGPFESSYAQFGIQTSQRRHFSTSSSQPSADTKSDNNSRVKLLC
ncbi:hypothetical protein XENOCAPTIV_016636 [Xenoophorus captivus]|uniref:Uncharacterized protein n=1 Tax=Xenoophorus captivus TaxID=1517983 RepID=A0ABV0R940_9TELE